MVVSYPPDLSGVERKIEESVKQVKQREWYQTWWGVLTLGIIASAIVAAAFYFF